MTPHSRNADGLPDNAPDDLIFRKALPADAPIIVELEAAAFAERSWGANGVVTGMELIGAHTLLALANNSQKPLGFVMYRLIGPDAELLSIGVDPGVQRHGIGAALLRNLCQTARQEGIGQLFLEVRASNNAAISLYERQGFVEIGRRKAYYKDGEDGLQMAIDLQINANTF